MKRRAGEQILPQLRQRGKNSKERETSVETTATLLERICKTGLANATREELGKAEKDVRGLLKDLPLAEAADIDKLRTATESVNSMLLRASVTESHKHDKLQIAQVWQAVAEVRHARTTHASVEVDSERERKRKRVRS